LTPSFSFLEFMMSDYQGSTALQGAPGLSPRLRTLGAEIGAFLDAILLPGALIRQVEDMGRLLRESRRVESTDPQRAATLLRDAQRACR
jgi:hypothetical protein